MASEPVRKVAFLIAASPDDAFYSQIAALTAQLYDLSWSRWRPSVHVYVGGDREADPIHDWRRYLADVRISWTSDERFQRDGDWAQSDDVFRFAPGDADVLVALDADTFPVAGFESMLDRVQDTGAVAGVVAHYSPAPGRVLRDVWTEVASGLTDAPLEFAHDHTLVSKDAPVETRRTPFYLNFGVVAFRRDAFQAIAPRYLAFRQTVQERLTLPDFSGQVALSLAIADAGVPTWALPMRYNFPNDPIADTMYGDELAQLAIVHYLRTSEFDRHCIFAGPTAYAAFVRQPLSGVNRVFRDAVVARFGESYPFPRDAALRGRQT